MPSNDKRPTFRSALRQRMEQAKTAPAPPRSRLTRRFTDFLIIAGGILLAYPLMSASYPLLLHGRLEANYTHAASSFAPLASSLATVQREASTELRAKHLAQAYRKNLRPGQPIGRIKIPTLGIDYLVLEGNRTTTLDPTTDVWLLRKGPVHYAKTPLPGEGEPFAVAGHRTTYGAPFRRLADLHRGDRIVVETPYARFTYSVAKETVVLPTETSVLRDRGYGLVLTTCTPPYSANQRLIVWAKSTGVTLKPPAPKR